MQKTIWGSNEEMESCSNGTVIKSFDDDREEVYLSRAVALGPLLASAAAKHDKVGTLSAEIVETLRRAGLFAMAVPRRQKGSCLSSRAMSEIVRELAKACPSTAWVVAVANACLGTVATFPEVTEAIVFEKEIPLMCSPTAGIGGLEKRGSEYLLSGRWSYGSGAHFAVWALVPATGETGERNMVVLPMANLRIERTWDASGLRGTGSDTLVATNIGVSATQIIRSASQSHDEIAQAKSTVEASDYWMGIPLLRSLLAAVLLGTAEGLLLEVCGMRDRPIVHLTYPSRSASPVWQAGLGKARAFLNSAHAILEMDARANDERANAGQILTRSERAIARGNSCVAIELMHQAVGEMMNLQGTSAFSVAGSAQRYWRDFSTGASHGLFGALAGYEHFGRFILGIVPGIIADERV